MINLSDRFETALQTAARLHARQTRKGTPVPYISHLLAVTALVLENGGDEDQSIAALLHDAAEDQGGLETLEEIRQLFGGRVARMVGELSDSFTAEKLPWPERKQAYLAHLPAAGRDTLLVSLADKVHNARSILRDLDEIGPEIWERFNGGRDGVLWYYRSLADVFKVHFPCWLADDLDRTVILLENRARM